MDQQAAKEDGQKWKTLTKLLNDFERQVKLGAYYPLDRDVAFKLDRLMEADKELCKLAKVAVDLPGKMPKSRIQDGDLSLSGSCAEGCMLARWFLDKPRSLPFDASVDTTQETLMLRRPKDNIFNVQDVLAAFLKGSGKKKAERYPERLGNLRRQAGGLVGLFFAGSPLATPRPNQATMTECSPLAHDPWEIEVDILANLGTIPKSCASLIERVPDKPIHLLLPFCEPLKACVKPVVWKKLREEKEEGKNLDIDTDGYFDPYKVKRTLGIISMYQDTDGYLALCLAWVFNVSAQNVKISIESEATKASHQYTIKAKITDHVTFNLASDFVGCFHVEFWPKEAEEWVTRSGRQWPGPELVSTIVAWGSQIVPRPSDQGQQTREFRWSFSHAEITLADNMSESQRRCYFALKMLYYREIKPLHKDLTSYMIKTTMLWTCEQHPPTVDMWLPANLAHTLGFLFEKLEGFFRERNLPMYFLPQLNLLAEKIPGEICKQVAAKIARIRPHLLQLIPLDGPLVVSAAMTQAAAVSRLLEISRLGTDHTITEFLKILMQKLVGSPAMEGYSFEQAHQDEVAAWREERRRNKRKHQGD